MPSLRRFGMDTRFPAVIVLSFFAAIGLSAAQEEGVGFPVLEGPYLGQVPPGTTPELFAPGIVCTEKNEGYLVFLQQGRVLVFDRWLPDSDDSDPYFVTRMKGKRWTPPRPSGHARSPCDPDLPTRPDANTLFFASNRSCDGEGDAETGWDIWMTRWTGDGFSGARRLDEPVSSGDRDAWASLAANGNLYFMSNRDGTCGRWDIYRAGYSGGGYIHAENIGPVVNSEYSEADPAIAPDESYLLFCSARPDGYGALDLYVTFRTPDGSWTKPQNLGPEINTAAGEEKPYVSPDGKYLFYSDDAAEHLQIRWVDVQIVHRLRPREMDSRTRE